MNKNTSEVKSFKRVQTMQIFRAEISNKLFRYCLTWQLQHVHFPNLHCFYDFQ